MAKANYSKLHAPTYSERELKAAAAFKRGEKYLDALRALKALGASRGALRSAARHFCAVK